MVIIQKASTFRPLTEINQNKGGIQNLQKTFDVVAFGEILIDFTFQGYNQDGQRLFVQNAGGAPANVFVAIERLGGRTAFIGKVGNDMHGAFLKKLWKIIT